MANETPETKNESTREETSALVISRKKTLLHKTNKAAIKIFSLIGAIVLWCFVVITENPVRQVWFYDVPIQLINKEALTEKKMVMLGDGTDLLVDVRVEGRRDILANLTRDKIVATLDLATVSEAGAVNPQPDVKIPGTDAVKIIDLRKAGKDLTIDTISTVTTEVESKITGDQAMDAAYSVRRVYTSPRTVTITGPSSLLGELVAATEKTDISGKTESGAQEVRVEVSDSAGNPVAGITVEPSVVTLNYELNIEATLKITPSLANENALNTRYRVTVEIEPNMVTVSGLDTEVRAIESIPTEAIDIKQIYESFEPAFIEDNSLTAASFVTEVNVPIVLPVNVMTETDEPLTEVKATVTYQNLSTHKEPIFIDLNDRSGKTVIGTQDDREPDENTEEEAQDEPNETEDEKSKVENKN